MANPNESNSRERLSSAWRLERLNVETVQWEQEVAEAMAAVRRMGRAVDREVSALNEAMDRLRAAMVRVLEGADALRGSTMRKAMEVLSPAQAVKFLVAAAEFQLRIRRWGQQRGSQRESDI